MTAVVVGISLLVGMLSANATRSAPSAVAAAAEAGPRLLLPLALTLALWMMCPDADNDLAVVRQALSLGDGAWTGARTAVLVVASWLVLACFLASSVTSALVKPGTQPVSEQAPGGPLIVAVLSATLYGVWSAALLRGRPSLPALSLCLSVILITVAVAFAPRNGIGDLARSAWPLAALRVIARGGESISPALGVTAVVSVCLTTLASVWALSRPLGRVRARARSSRVPLVQARRMILAGVAVAVFPAGAVLPTLLTRDLPWTSRPATVIQKLSGTDPSSQARRFLEAVWSQNQGVADSLTMGRSVMSVLGPYAAIAGARPNALDIHTVLITELGTARVQADGFSQTIALCMSYRDNAWLVANMTTTPTCP